MIWWSATLRQIYSALKRKKKSSFKQSSIISGILSHTLWRHFSSKNKTLVNVEAIHSSCDTYVLYMHKNVCACVCVYMYIGNIPK